MTWHVLVSELRKASGTYETVADGVGPTVQITHLEPDSVGQIELTAWLKAVVDQCGKATTALHHGAAELSGGLQEAAHDYEVADDSGAQMLTCPALGPDGSAGGPFGGPPIVPGPAPSGTPTSGTTPFIGPIVAGTRRPGVQAQ